MSRRKPLQITRATGNAHTRKLTNRLEALWDDLLSRHPERIKAAYASLDVPEQQAVISHLQRMLSENGWQPEQRLSARAALRALEDQV